MNLVYAGYSPVTQLASTRDDVERWSAVSDGLKAELYLGSADLLARARSLPGWGPFPAVRLGTERGRCFVLVPGQLTADLPALADQLAPGPRVVLGWHLASALAELHDQGGAHGMLHPRFVGLGPDGSLCIRPAMGIHLGQDPDDDAAAQATDCYQLGQLLRALRIDEVDEPTVALVLASLARDRARLRMQPGRAVRQALTAVLHRHRDWEEALVTAFGRRWWMSEPVVPVDVGVRALRQHAAWSAPVDPPPPAPAPGTTGPPVRVQVGPAVAAPAMGADDPVLDALEAADEDEEDALSVIDEPPPLASLRPIVRDTSATREARAGEPPVAAWHAKGGGQEHALEADPAADEARQAAAAETARKTAEEAVAEAAREAAEAAAAESARRVAAAAAAEAARQALAAAAAEAARKAAEDAAAEAARKAAADVAAEAARKAAADAAAEAARKAAADAAAEAARKAAADAAA
jgi:hypothetical protein